MTHFPFVSSGTKHMPKHFQCYGSSSLSNAVPELLQCGNALAEYTSFDKSPLKMSIGMRSGELAATSRGLRFQSTAQGNVNSRMCERLRHNDMVTDAAMILDSSQWISWWFQSFHWMLNLFTNVQVVLYVGPSWWNLGLNCARTEMYEDPCSRHVTIATFSYAERLCRFN